MIAYEEALAIIQQTAQQLPLQRCAATVGQVLAEAVISTENLPPFDNSAMDGFALQIGATTLAAGAEFAVVGAQAAGDAQAVAGNSDAWEIMTGARLPDGLDAVIPIEQVEVLASDVDGRPQRIRTTAEVLPRQHVRRCGEDVASGTQVIAAGTRLEAQHVMLLAALGVKEVVVRRVANVALLNTGRELVDDPAQALASGEIRNSNGPYLAARVIDAGAELVLRETVSDDVDAFLTALKRALEAGADVVLSTGAVSMGRYDFVPDALRSIGAIIHFHKVNIRPGKPLLFASLPNGTLFFGLPGNPVSSAVGLRFFVEPALRVMAGMASEQPMRVPLAGDVNKRAALRFHLKGRLEMDANGQLQARVLPGQESFRILPLLDANCWVVIEASQSAPAAGTQVKAYGLGHLLAPRIDGAAR